MMLKKPALKRKAKQTFNKFIFLGTVFLITLGILLSFFLLAKLKRRVILSPLPKITLSKNQENNLNQTNQINSMLEKQGINVDQIFSASDSSTIVTLKDGGQIVFSDKKKLDEQMASLQLITRQITIEGRRFKRIDFRFDNPVIVFKYDRRKNCCWS